MIKIKGIHLSFMKNRHSYKGCATLIPNEIPNEYPKKQKDGPRIAMPRAQLSSLFFLEMAVSSSLFLPNKLKPFFLLLFTRRETKKWPTQLLTYENSLATCFFLFT